MVTPFRGSGGLVARINGFDWRATPVGPLADWPLALRHAVQLALDSPVPTLIAWGADLAVVHNDAYAPLLGDRGCALGRPLLSVWADVARVVAPLVERVLAGGTVPPDAATLVTELHGVSVAAWAGHSMLPLRDDGGAIAGVMVQVPPRAVPRPAASTGKLLAGFRGLFDAVPTALLAIAPPDWVIVGANDAHLKITGTLREAVIGRRLMDVFPDDPDAADAEAARTLAASLQRVLATGTTDTLTALRYPLRDIAGRFEDRWWNVINSPVLDGAGAIAVVIQRIEEVTDLIQMRGEREIAVRLAREQHALIERLRGTEAALAQSEARARANATELEQLYAKAPLGLGLVDRELRFVRVNAALAEMNGWPVAVHIGKSAWDIVPDLRATAEPALRRVLETGEPLTDVAVRGTTAARPGMEREWREQFYPLHDEAGKVIGIGILCEEVTERLQLERRIKASEAHLRQVLDQLFAFVGTLTPDGVLVEANRAPLDAAGLARGDVIGRHFAEAHWWSYDPGVQQRLRAAITAAAAGETVRYDVPVAMAGGTVMTIDFQLAPLRDEAGGISHLIASGVVIDDRLAAEAELRALNETLETRVRAEVARREVTQAALMQAQKLEALGQLTSGIAHDFNNVIQAISAGFVLIGKRTTDPKVAEIAEHSIKAAQRGGAIVNQLLSFARQRPLETRKVDVCTMLADALPLLERSAGPRVRLVLDCPPDVGAIMTDPGLLEAALINLVVNARDAMPGGGRIDIRAWRTDAAGQPRIVIAVEDDGEGMAPEVLARVAEPFFTTKEQGKGTGLGLAMVHGFVEQCGGTLGIDSRPGEGTWISIALPVADDGLPAFATAIVSRSRKTVLLVDDDENVRALAAMQLEDLGFAVVQAGDGEAALALFEATRDRGEAIHLILSDVRMPRMDGPAFVRHVRMREQVPVIFMTGFAPAHELAGETVLDKPFSDGDLATALASIWLRADDPAG